MRIKCWGSRGSIPVSGKEYIKYGGDTTCLEIRTKDEKIIIVDAIDAGKTPGEIFELPIDEIPEKKIDDFSMHQLPTSNLLKELKDLCKVNVIIIACQVEYIPEEVATSISKKITDAIPEVCKRINEIIKNG